MEVINKLAIVKLISGEELIGTIHHKQINDESSFSINFPLVIMLMPEGRLTVRPWLFCKEYNNENGEIMINPVAIVAIATPADELVSAYNEFKRQQFSNIIIKPTQEQQNIIVNTIQ